MIKIDENALICDLAETYHIYNYKGLPLLTVATLACGLGHNSRIATKMAGNKYPFDTMIMAAIADRLAILLWRQTKDGQKGRNRPKLLLEQEKEKDEILTFSSGAEFEAYKKRLLKGEK